MMIDFHTHIIPNIDDGSRNVNETFNLINEAYDAGFNKIISTSHYLKGKYEMQEKDRRILLNAIRQKVKSETPEMEFYLGSEIFISHNMVDFLIEKKASTINNTSYVLFELPMEKNVIFLKEILFKLAEYGYKPIIAHPERYKFFQKNPNDLIELIEMGVLFQSNFGSLIGIYGKEAKKTVKRLLQANMVHFLGSDVHRENSIYKRMPEILKILKDIISEREIEELTTTNAEYILNDEEIEIESPKKIKFLF